MGIARGCISLKNIENIYGMNNGVEGFLNEWLIDLKNQPKGILEKLKYTPSSALGVFEV
jgi:hypothetical protein